jgi:hypothetical protein
MAEYDNEKRGVLFKNDKKTSDLHPDYKGNMTAEGKDYWLSAWIKRDKNGKAFMSLSLQPKETPPAQAAKPAKAAAGGVVDDADEIPFDNPYRGRICYVV